MLFSVLILVFLWTFQVLFLGKYYKYVKTKEIKQVANTILQNKYSSNLENIIEKEAYNKGFCVEIIDQDNHVVYSSAIMNRGCLDANSRKMFTYKQNFIDSKLKEATFSVINPRFNNETLVNARKISNQYYAFINTSLDPIDSTVNILQSQLFYVTIIVLILAFFIAYFISKHISNPIVKINKAAKKLSKGEFNVVFDSSENIEEITELAKTLSYTRDELEKTDELRRDLMANVSHDLKTPLTMIKAYAEMARDLNQNNKQKRNQNINIIIEECDRLTLLVNDILELSKMQSELDILHLEEFDLGELISNILKKYDVFRIKENYKFIFDNNKKIIVEADKNKLEQAIYNLINNAINYTGEDNKVTIKLESDKDFVTVNIMDTGKGIDEEDIPYIWDKYYKNKKKHKRGLIGTGLGLSIVKNVLELHNYEYGVKTKKGQGSNFYFKINKVKS